MAAATSSATAHRRRRAARPAATSSVLFKPSLNTTTAATAVAPARRARVIAPSKTAAATAAPPPLSAAAVVRPVPLPPTPSLAAVPRAPAVSPFQRRVYAALLQIPAGRVATYAGLARAVGTAPRAVGGALRRNPWAPQVPCHRIVQADGYVGGFMGSWHQAPSGVNCERKIGLLAGEGVWFDEKGYLADKGVLWDEFTAV